ncbi:uncharacterized protein LOC113788574 [Dermatophagoides pteronyssinus]|uniref:uncharacterized protein LOC113788574 n=1 Tax=Dermatophagoides pteronyssinus TaxID=6956 RepID=UPI003F6637A8
MSCIKICSGILLFLAYHLILLLLALMNTAVWTTELPRIQLWHHPSLYAVVKGFNVFFGTFIICIILVICFKIGDHILSIANLRIRANYNFYLLIISFIIVFCFPIIYVYIARHIGTMMIQEKLTNFTLLTLICFIAIDSMIIFVFAIFLLLTSIMSTMRSYNIFRHLVKLSEDKKQLKKKQQQQQPKSNVKIKRIEQLRRYPGHHYGVYPGHGRIPAKGVYQYPLKSKRNSNQQQTPDHRVYRVESSMTQRYGYGYVATPTLTLSDPSGSFDGSLQQQQQQQQRSNTSTSHPLSETAVYLV